MKKTSKFCCYLIGFLFLLFSSCRKEISLPDDNLKNIFGKWEWISTSGGLQGGTKTPSSEGYAMTIEFDKYGRYREFKNSKLKEKMKFSLRKESSSKSFIDYKDTGLFDKKDYRSSAEIKFFSDTLVLDEGCCDKFVHVYIKKK